MDAPPGATSVRYSFLECTMYKATTPTMLHLPKYMTSGTCFIYEQSMQKPESGAFVTVGFSSLRKKNPMLRVI